MNNGVTIIAKTLRITGNKFYIEDYQIVNGCQTSHVLFDNRSYLDPSVYVPLRIIASSDDGVIACVVKATNRQTEIKREQLIALSDFQKKLEAYFLSFPTETRLYYERRSRQYASQQIEKLRIVTPANLIRGFASIFLEEPHRATRTFRLLLEQVGTNIFASNHVLEPYYLVALMAFRLENLFRKGIIDRKQRPARFQIYLAARIIMTGDQRPAFNSHEMSRLAQSMIESILDQQRGEQVLKTASEIVSKVIEGNFDRDHIRTQPITQKLLQEAKTEFDKAASISK